MRRKKNKRVSSSRVWFYYCDSEFDSENLLVFHQQTNHFNCHLCHLQLSSAPAMASHVFHLHQETVTKVPNAKPGRESTEIRIHGMQGIPQDILAARYRENEEVPSKTAKVDTPFTQLVGEVPGKLGISYASLSTQGLMQPIYCSALPVPPAGLPPLAPTTSPVHQPLLGLKFERTMWLLENLNPTMRLHREKIEEHFSKHTHTPDHPPYASMIQRAITELNEHGGSSEKTILKFIEEKYVDLPIAHATQLTRHLQKLVNKGEVVCTSANCYMLSFENTDFGHNFRKKKKLSKRFGKNRKFSGQRNFRGVQSQKEQKIEDGQEQNQVQQGILERIEEQKQAEQKSRLIGEQKNQEPIELIGEQNEVDELGLKVVDELIEAEQYKEGNEERNQIQGWQNQPQNPDLQQSRAPSKTIDVTIEENYRAEGSNLAEKNSEVTEAEHQNDQEEEVTKEQNEVFELPLLVVEQIESEQDRERNKKHDQLEELENQQQKELNLQQRQALSETVCLTIEENYQEVSNLAEKNTEVTEAKHQKKREDQVTKEPYHEELESKKHEDKNQTANTESEVGDEQDQLPDIQLEETVGQIDERRHFEGSEEKKLLEQKMDVCSQIFDLRNMLLQLMKKEKEATVSIQNNVTGQKVDVSDLSRLKKEEFMELLKKTNKIQGKLIEIVSSMSLEVSENNNSMPKVGGQQELVEAHLRQTENPCTGRETAIACGFQPKQQQQANVCGQVMVASYQANIISSSANLRTDSMQPVENNQIELPSQKRPPEVETMTGEDLFEKPSKKIKLCDQQETPKSQAKLLEISLDVPCNLLHEEDGNEQLVTQRMVSVVEDNSETTELNIKFSGEAAISGQPTENSYLNTCMDSEQLKSSELCGLENLPEFQKHDLEHQQQTTFNTKEKRSECKEAENPNEGKHREHDPLLVEHPSQSEQQMVERGQQMQIQPFSQMPSTSQLDTATSVGKQLDQAKQMHQRQLRSRGGRPTETEQVLPIIEADHDLTLGSLKSEKKKKSPPLILRRLQEQQKNHPHKKKGLKSQGTEITFDSAITPSQVKRGLQHLQEQKQSESQRRGRGRPPKRKGSAGASNHRNHKDKQPQNCRLGRPTKSESAATIDASLPPQR